MLDKLPPLWIYLGEGPAHAYTKLRRRMPSGPVSPNSFYFTHIVQTELDAPPFGSPQPALLTHLFSSHAPVGWHGGDGFEQCAGPFGNFEQGILVQCFHPGFHGDAFEYGGLFPFIDCGGEFVGVDH